MAGNGGRASREERRARAQARRGWRQQVAQEAASSYGGVARRTDLLAAGLSRHDIRAELEHGSWHAVGTHTICIAGPEPQGHGLLWRALWETSSHAVLDGVTSLQVAGLKNFTWGVIEVSVPNNVPVRALDGVRHHQLRDLGATTRAGVPRVRTELAVIRAAQWARSDAQAATIVAMTVQQDLVRPSTLLETWSAQRRSARRKVLDEVIRDVCDGARSLGELDFARLCRARGLPAPSRQVIRPGRHGRVYLDVFWDDLGVHVEIQGAHHMQGLKGLDDALRNNHIGITHPGVVTLQIPVLGLRLRTEEFLAQVETALAGARSRLIEA